MIGRIFILLVLMALLANTMSGLALGKMWCQTRVIGRDDPWFMGQMTGQIVGITFLGLGLWLGLHAGQPAP